MTTTQFTGSAPAVTDAPASRNVSRSGVEYESLGTARTLLVIAYVLVSIWYLAYRPTTFNPGAMTFSVVLYAAEVFGFVCALMHLFMVWRLSVRTPPVPLDGMSVDVFVTTYNEPVTMLRRTLLAALRMDYPHETWLLDDGNRPEMRTLAEELNVRYIARSKNVDAKAGNLNNALQQSRGEIIALFDSDHAPARDFLRRTLGYFRDAKVAFVQTPQDFYNLDSFQHRSSRRRPLLWHEQSLFYRVIQRGKDYSNSTFFCGSCAALRRKSLDEIGGFAVNTVTEDLATSVRLHKKGWKAIYHRESLAFGLAPARVVPFLKQRLRWGRGAMQELRTGGIVFGRGLTMAQRINYFASVVTYFDGWQKGVFYLAPVIVLITGVMPIAQLTWEFLLHFIPFYILTFWTFEEVGRGYGRTINTEQYNMARFAAFVWATLGIFGRRFKFNVTSKQLGTSDEPRTWILPQSLIFLLNVVAVPVGIIVTWMNGYLPTGALVANIVWAAVNASLAQAVIGFTSRMSGFKRSEYRFAVPLSAQVQFSHGEPVGGVIDDISAQGFKFYGRFPENIKPHTLLSGTLHLPTGQLPFRAEVRSLMHSEQRPTYVKAIGCSFVWASQAERDELDSLLYGSNLQVRLNRFSEQAHTPFDWFARHFSSRKYEADPRRERWAAALSQGTRTQEPAITSIVSVPDKNDQTRTLVTYQPLQTGQPIKVVAITRTGAHQLQGSCEPIETIPTAGAPMFVYRYVASPATR